MSRRTFLLAVVALALAHALSFHGSGPFDDDFIVQRYARNWVEGQGLVFNPGERIEGFTVPLWVLMIAGALELGISAPLASALLSIAALVPCVYAIGRVWQLHRPQARWFAPALLLALTPAFAWHAVAGLGTSTLAALLALWLWSYERAHRAQRPAVGAALLLGCACLMRAEAIVWVLPFVCSETRRRRVGAALLALVPLAGWTVFRLAYYGRWLPNPYALKKLPLFTDLRYGAEYLAASTASSGIALLVGLALWFGVAARRRERGDASVSTAAGPDASQRNAQASDALEPLIVASIGLALHTAYVVYVGGDFMPLARFFVPALPFAWLLACLALTELVRERAALLASLGFITALALQWPQLVTRPELFARHAAEEERWEKLGRDLGQRLPPGTRVALAPIGAFGFYSRLPIVDLLGLTNDAVPRAPPDLSITMKGHHRYDADWVLTRRPGVVILGNGELAFDATQRPQLVISAWERTLFAHPTFKRDYVPLKIDVEGSYPLIFYMRRDLPLPRGATRA